MRKTGGKRENVIGESKTPRIRNILKSNLNLAKDIQKLRYLLEGTNNGLVERQVGPANRIELEHQRL